MNKTRFAELLQQLPDADWRAINQGMILRLIDDEQLAPGPPPATDAIIQPPGAPLADTASLREAALADAAELLDDYYRTHPLTLTGFKRQARKLIVQHGAGAFTAPSGELPPYTLFVDGGTLVAESTDSPRHRYGIYYESTSGLRGTASSLQVERWLESGEAYQAYLATNVCRYNC